MGAQYYLKLMTIFTEFTNTKVAIIPGQDSWSAQVRTLKSRSRVVLSNGKFLGRIGNSGAYRNFKTGEGGYDD